MCALSISSTLLSVLIAHVVMTFSVCLVEEFTWQTKTARMRTTPKCNIALYLMYCFPEFQNFYFS